VTCAIAGAAAVAATVAAAIIERIIIVFLVLKDKKLNLRFVTNLKYLFSIK
jgi:hypothetical protein